jgi:hypothetical protein
METSDLLTALRGMARLCAKVRSGRTHDRRGVELAIIIKKKKKYIHHVTFHGSSCHHDDFELLFLLLLLVSASLLGMDLEGFA